MSPIQKKICMLGGFGVGKTSLVKRFVTGLFSEQYHTTIGVKIDQKKLDLDGKQMLLILWDLYGEDDYQKILPSYLQGSSGYVLVVDGTRKETVAIAIQLHQLARKIVGRVPYVLLVNKEDLIDEWVLEPPMLEPLSDEAVVVVESSAKTGRGVDQAFRELCRKTDMTFLLGSKEMDPAFSLEEPIYPNP